METGHIDKIEVEAALNERTETGGFGKEPGRYRPFLFGLAAASAVIVSYVGLLTLTSGWHAAKLQFAEFFWWITALAIGLGIQVSLYTFSRQRLAGRSKTAAKGTLAASSGMSTTAMAACCTHYMAAFLPALGLPFLSAAAAALADYQVYFFMAGVLSNLIGIGIMLRLMKKHRVLPARPWLWLWPASPQDA